MSNEQINIETVLKGNNQVEQLVKNLRDGSNVANQYTQRIKELSVALKGLNPRVLNNLGKTLAQGTPQSFVRNSATTGQIKDFEAQMTNVMSRVINRFAKGMNDAVKAANNLDVLKLKGVRQLTPANNLPDLNNQILAQQARYAERVLQTERLRGAAATSVNQKALEEKAILDQLILKREALLAIEKQRKAQAGLVQATQLNQSKANDPAYQQSLRDLQQQRILGDGGASLFKIQAQLLVNYMLMNKVFQLFQFGTGYIIDFDAALKDLQAITNTTNTEMEGLSKTIVEVSTNTKFNAVEIAKAATIMGQAGFSASQIEKSIGSIALLATATGSDLTQSVDVATSAITVFNLNASEMGHVADVMTGALNLSKLTMDKLALGIQYAGNTAAESGITLEELVSVLGAISNAGIKSGSTIGTGFRQMLVEFQNPTRKLTEQLTKVGLTIADVDVKSKGITGVMETLAKAGFNASNAFKALDLRGAAAFVALSRNIDTMKQLQVQLLLTNAASEANARQMESLANSGAKLSNTFGSVILNIGEPIKQALIAITNATSAVLEELNKLPVILPLIGIALTSVFGAAILVHIGKLVANILQLSRVTAIEGVIAEGTAIKIGSYTLATVSASAATTLWGRALLFLGATPIGRLATGIALATAAVWGISEAMSSNSQQMDKLQADIDITNGRYTEYKDRIESVDKEIERLTNRYATLKGNSSDVKEEVLAMQLRFGEFSKNLRSGTITTVEDLIKTLRELQGEMRNLGLKELDNYILEQSNLARQKLNKLHGNTNDISSTTSLLSLYDDGSGTTGASKIKDILSEADNSKIKETLAKIKDQDISTLDFKGLQEVQNDLIFILGKYQDADGKLLADARELLNTGEKDTGDIDKDRAAIKLKIGAVSAELNRIRDIQTKQEQKIVEQLANSPATQAYTDSLDKLNENLSEAKQTFEGATTTDAKRAAKKALMDAKNALDDFQQEYLKGIDNINVKNIAEQTGAPASLVKKSLDETVGNRIASSISAAESALSNTTNGLAESTADFFDKYTELSKLAIARLEKEIQHSTDKLKIAISSIDATKTETADRRSRGQNPIYSDQEIRLMDDKKKQLETESIGVEIDKTKELLPLLKDRVNYEAKLLAASVQSYNDSKGTRGEGKALKTMVESQRDYDDAKEKQITLETKLAELEQQRAARLKTVNSAQMSLSDSIMESVQHYMQVMEIQNDFRLNIDKNVTHVLDEASGAFTDFVTNVATGSKSIGDSFREMAGRIIKAMLDIAAQQAATGLFSLFGGIFKSIVSSITGTTSSISGSDTLGSGDPGADTLGANSGGYIKRFAMGGGNPNRDSRLALLRPGEYVMRNSAVDMIGRDTLDMMNAMGNQRESVSGGVIGNAAAANQGIRLGTPVNVYVVSPEAKPPLGKNDVIAIITEDMVKGGQTKKLLKSIVGGLS